MIQYILECIAFQLVFLVIYDFFLKRETFFQWNRLYLIGTYVLSLVLPWVKIEALRTTVPEQYYVYPEFLWSANSVSATATSSERTGFDLSWEEGVLYTGMVLAALYFGYKLFQLYKLRKAGAVRRFPNFTQIVVNNSELAFSFFKSIFLGDKVVEREHQSIIQHELVHIEQRHSWDLLFFELMRIVGWFNPLVYVYQSRVSELHEFIADSKMAKTDKKQQYEFLLSQIFQTENISFVNQFFKSSLIKKRITMLQRAKSKKVWQLKYLLLVPLVLGMLLYTSSEAQDSENFDQEQTSDDTALIESLNVKIEEERERLGSMDKVHRNFSGKYYKSSVDTILSKEAYFEGELISKMHFSEYADSLEKAETPFFRRDKLLKRPLPSTKRYEIYVQRAKAFRILDKNLRLSISTNRNNEGLGILLVEENTDYGNGYALFEVEDVRDLTGSEVRTFNNKLDETFKQNASEYAGLILTDGTYTFEIFKTKPFDDVVENRPRENGPEVITVNDIENLTQEEVHTIFGRLKTLSNTSSFWQLFIKDKNSQLKFVPSEDDSYISSPDGERINAKLAFDSKLGSKEASELASVLTKMEQSRQDLLKYSKQEDQTSLIDKYNQLLAERKRLLKSSNEKNPVIVNLDQQIAGLRKAAFGDGEIIPFAVVEEVPVFPGCEDEDNKRACFQEKIQRHISKNFRYPKEAQEMGIQGRVAIMFTISETGLIQNIRKRGPDQSLEDEAVRIITRLPKMTPGKHEGKIVNVPFSIPITFKLQGQQKTSPLSLNLDALKQFSDSPLYIIDGEEATKEAMGFIDRKEIESINVLKDEAAFNLYGEKGKNGVVLIQTKKNSIDTKEPSEIYKAGTSTISVKATATDESGFKLISGTVTDGMMALPGATIAIQGSEKGVISDFDGNFQLKAKKGDVIVLQYIGLPILKFTVTDEENYQMTKKK